MPVLHSAVIRVASLEVLCEHTAPNAAANYSDLTLKVLKRVPSESNGGGDLDGKKKTFIVQGVTYNFTGLRDLVFVCVADEASGRILPFSFLNEVLDSHQKQFRGTLFRSFVEVPSHNSLCLPCCQLQAMILAALRCVTIRVSACCSARKWANTRQSARSTTLALRAPRATDAVRPRRLLLQTPRLD